MDESTKHVSTMLEKLTERHEYLENKVNNVDKSVARVEETLKNVHEDMVMYKESHDSLSKKADDAHKRLDYLWLRVFKDLRWVALLVSGIGGAVYFVWGVVNGQ